MEDKTIFVQLLEFGENAGIEGTDPLSGTENISLKNLAKILYMLGYELNLSISKIV